MESPPETQTYTKKISQKYGEHKQSTTPQARPFWFGFRLTQARPQGQMRGHRKNIDKWTIFKKRWKMLNKKTTKLKIQTSGLSLPFSG